VIPALKRGGGDREYHFKMLDAKEQIKEMAGFATSRSIVVSDGSTDRTAEIAGLLSK